jgi:hypothetical protein
VERKDFNNCVARNYFLKNYLTEKNVYANQEPSQTPLKYGHNYPTYNLSHLTGMGKVLPVLTCDIVFVLLENTNKT